MLRCGGHIATPAVNGEIVISQRGKAVRDRFALSGHDAQISGSIGMTDGLPTSRC
jgi:hypothetical protein